MCFLVPIRNFKCAMMMVVAAEKVLIDSPFTILHNDDIAHEILPGQIVVGATNKIVNDYCDQVLYNEEEVKIKSLVVNKKKKLWSDRFRADLIRQNKTVPDQCHS